MCVLFSLSLSLLHHFVLFISMLVSVLCNCACACVCTRFLLHISKPIKLIETIRAHIDYYCGCESERKTLRVSTRARVPVCAKSTQFTKHTETKAKNVENRGKTRRRRDNEHIKHKLTNEWENSFLVKLSSLGLAPLILSIFFWLTFSLIHIPANLFHLSQFCQLNKYCSRVGG